MFEFIIATLNPAEQLAASLAAERALDLASAAHHAGQTIADTAIRIQEAYARFEAPSPRLIAALRRELGSIAAALTAYEAPAEEAEFSGTDGA